MEQLINPNPVVHEVKARRHRVGATRVLLWHVHGPTPMHAVLPLLQCTAQPLFMYSSHTALPPDPSSFNLPQVPAPTGSALVREPIDAAEVFDHIRDITDPEHPYTLEQLHVVEEEAISVEDTAGRVRCVIAAAAANFFDMRCFAICFALPMDDTPPALCAVMCCCLFSLSVHCEAKEVLSVIHHL
jgi:Iron-sulfur cluster assembly protein